MCGEIPQGHEYSEKDVLTFQGGQVKCMVVDMRTSSDMAKLQRIQARNVAESARKDKDVTISEKMRTSLLIFHQQALKYTKKLEDNLESTKEQMLAFLTKNRRYFNQGRITFKKKITISR